MVTPARRSIALGSAGGGGGGDRPEMTTSSDAGSSQFWRKSLSHGGAGDRGDHARRPCLSQFHRPNMELFAARGFARRARRCA
jgi:hypothetical protein